ncbi:hypothetical protein GGI04_000591 [Coemansia thaxteri]|nr:hypothetical protein GGI04_000591 [Coemansia thaxteri]
MSGASGISSERASLGLPASGISAQDPPLVLSASDEYPSENLRLLELTEALAAQLEEASVATLTVRGRAADTAVLVGADGAAYQMHTAHTSNSVYVLARTEAGLELRAKVSQTFELQPTRPQIAARVAEVLAWDERGGFRGMAFERAEPSGRRVTDAELSRHVAGSDAQRRRVLAGIPAAVVDGAWRRIDGAYSVEVLRLAVASAVENDWALDAVDARLAWQALQADDAGLPLAVVDAVLARFSRPPSGGAYAIDARRVARFLAELIFEAEGARTWPAAELVRALRAAMPPQLLLAEGAELVAAWGSADVPRSAVRGLAYASAPIDAHLLYAPAGLPHHATYLTPLSRCAMPGDPRSRLRCLFAAKPRWSRDEIVPFMDDLVDVDPDLLDSADAAAVAAVAKAVDAWLVKFARATRAPSGDMVYTSRLN